MSEKIYDEQVAPLLRQVRDICAEHKMPMLAVVQFGYGDWGRMVYAPEGGFPMANMRTCHYFTRTANFDSAMSAVLSDAQRHGHSSVYLQLLGVAPTPVQPDRKESQP